MASKDQQQPNGIWQASHKPHSLREWVAGHNLQVRALKKIRTPQPVEQANLDLDISPSSGNGPHQRNIRVHATLYGDDVAQTDTMTITVPRTPGNSAANTHCQVEVEQATNGPLPHSHIPGKFSHLLDPMDRGSHRGRSQRPRRKPCTAKMGLELGGKASVGTCICDDYIEDRSDVERALRESQLERALKKAKNEKRAQSIRRGVKFTDDTLDASKSLKHRKEKRSSSLSSISSFWSSADDDDSDIDSDGSDSSFSHWKSRKNSEKSKRHHGSKMGASENEPLHERQRNRAVAKQQSSNPKGMPAKMNTAMPQGMLSDIDRSVPFPYWRPQAFSTRHDLGYIRDVDTGLPHVDYDPVYGNYTNAVQSRSLGIVTHSRPQHPVPVIPVPFPVPVPVSVPVYYPIGVESGPRNSHGPAIPKGMKGAEPSNWIQMNNSGRQNPMKPNPDACQNIFSNGPPLGVRGPPPVTNQSNASRGPSPQVRGPPPQSRGQTPQARGPPPQVRGPPSGMRCGHGRTTSQGMPTSNKAALSAESGLSVRTKSADGWDRVSSNNQRPAEKKAEMHYPDFWEKERLIAEFFKGIEPERIDDVRHSTRSHRNLAYPPGYNALDSAWRSGGSDLSVGDRHVSPTTSEINLHNNGNDRNGTKRGFSVPGAWCEPSDAGSSVQQEGSQNRWGEYHGGLHTHQNRQPNTSYNYNSQPGPNGTNGPLPPWADLTAAQSSDDPPAWDPNHGRRAPENVQW